MLLEFTHSNFELHFHIKTGLKILSFMVEMLNESINWVWWSRERKMTSPSVVQLSNRATYKHAEERVTFWWCESCSWQKIITNNYCCANHTISKSLLLVRVISYLLCDVFSYWSRWLPQAWRHSVLLQHCFSMLVS